ncbi:ABC transporter permease subunit/CPBP intramembrane protease [Planctomicrobium sp. SH668]|uniref:ABC transporter permease subunit/CPBP intramembrane protease n=1 Tax=Planctomicrobium sp. SH668 TaxID=3448126 RepID=UPI003F5B9640
MSWKNVKLIFQREVRDQLRDRRTLFMVAVLPLLLYPLLGIGMVQMTVTFSEQVRRVVIVGADQIPLPSLLNGNEFDTSYFENPETAKKLRVITDLPGSLGDDLPPETRKELSELLEQVNARRGRIARLGDVQQELELAETNSASPVIQALREEEEILRQEIEDWFGKSRAQVLIVFPPDFLAQYNQITAEISSPERDLSAFSELARPVMLHNSANEKSEIAYQRVRQAFQKWEKALLEGRLKSANLPLSLPTPVQLTKVDLAEPTQLAANVWSKIFPALLVIMSVTGAFYPAIDLGAGEKERGTMETLLISPATRTEIVFGKFLTIMLFSFSTALLNLVSMGFTGKHMLSAIGSTKSSPIGDLSFPPMESLMWVVLLAIPLAALFSALSLSLALFARSSKEGQYYLTPLLLVTMGMTMFCLNPAVELNPYYSVLPITGPALLLKSLLLGSSDSQVATFIAPVLLMSCFYSAVALWWATEQFKREDILFRESERFEIGLWFRHLLREKEANPSFTEAAVCFVVIALLQFLFLTSMQNSPELLDGPVKMVQVQLIYLIATVGVPPVLMALLLTTRPLQTLKLRLPDWRMMAVGAILAFTLQPLALTLMTFLDPYFPPLPPGAQQLMEAMGTGTVPLWLSLAAFALAPAVCEELAFRGFILSGLQRSNRPWLPIVISALVFGAIHMIPKQQFNAALLGLVIGLLAVRSRSLYPGILFHFIFNGSQVLASRLQVADYQSPVAQWMVWIDPAVAKPEPHFRPEFLLFCLTISVVLITWLVRFRPKEDSENFERSHRSATTVSDRQAEFSMPSGEPASLESSS